MVRIYELFHKNGVTQQNPKLKSETLSFIFYWVIVYRVEKNISWFIKSMWGFHHRQNHTKVVSLNKTNDNILCPKL